MENNAVHQNCTEGCRRFPSNPDLSELEAYPHFLAIDKVMKDNKGYFGGAVVPEEVMREVTSDGAIYMAPEDSIPYEYFNNKVGGLEEVEETRFLKDDLFVSWSSGRRTPCLTFR